MIMAYEKLGGSGLSVRTSQGGRICLDGDETKALCAMLPALFPEHFEVLQTITLELTPSLDHEPYEVSHE